MSAAHGPRPPRGFASDNASGIHPEALDAIAAVNDGHADSYGEDATTASMAECFREHLGPAARAFPVFNGTGANVGAITALTRPHHAVICAAGAHLDVDECGAPERIAGVKLLTVATPDGKLTPKRLDDGIDWHRVGDEHASQPRVLSISNSTELGTVYNAAEVAALAGFAHERDLLLHVDGARICNAAAALDTSLAAVTTDAGVDVLSFGGTKNGLLGAEAVVFLREGIGEDFAFVRKQTTQLASKMRFISAQLEALLSDDLWRRNASHANEMARALGGAVDGIEGIKLAQPVEANGVFLELPPEQVKALEFTETGERAFHVWDARRSIVRLMCSWDTTAEDVEAFAERLGTTIDK